ncbi:hypothetical protein OUQ99_11135 [Streptomonospora nanhaiensis]|uniref:Peptidase M48 domain-containing protein n=1 Tax=Streptomonospora nanhaiensis TaxID=1323731 RepID=A0ABY6YTQ0_9ACTN|nr:hypothetical protein [Streptomonospora nanhaiensis]WAE75592.1 hypothetical protein OUQ99_11135 [Streptomonospora nanhaiensis]
MQIPLAEERETDPPPSRAFDPFLLPSATSIRFFLIILLAAVGSMYIGFFYLPTVPVLGVDPTGTEAAAVCAEQARTDAGRLSDQVLFEGYADCIAAADRAAALWMVIPGLLWAALTVLVYALYPRRLEKRLRPGELPDESGARAVLREVEAALGNTRQRVRILVTPGTAGGARVFGAFGRYRMAVDGSLLVPRKDGELDQSARAVIRHEAAHLRNRDVDITYLTMSSWWGFVLVNTGPLALYGIAFLYETFFSASGGYLLAGAAVQGLLLTAATLVLVQTARARVLRSREHYADVRAAGAGHIGASLRHLLAQSQWSGEGSLIRRRWRGLRDYHPSHRARGDILDDPRRLTASISGADLVTAGIVLGAAHLHLSIAAFMASAGGLGGISSTSVVLGLPVGALVTAMVWNVVRAAPEARHRWAGSAAALAGGVLIAHLPPAQPGTWWVYLLLSNPLAALVSGLVLWCVCLLFLRWAALSGRAWLAAEGRERMLCLLGMACGAVVFGCGFGVWVYLHAGIPMAFEGGGLAPVVLPLVALVTDVRFHVAVGCAMLFAFGGLVRRARLRGIARHPLVPVVAGCALSAVYGVLLPLGVVLAADGGYALRFVFLLPVWLAAVAVSVALGAWSGGPRLRGAGPCVAAVLVFTVLALEPLVYGTVFEGLLCLATRSPSECAAAVGGAVLTGYAEPVFLLWGLPVLLALCGGGAAAGSRVRSAIERRRPTSEEPDIAAPRRRRHVIGVLAAVVATVTVLGSAVVESLPNEITPIAAERKPPLLAQVESSTVGREQACEQGLESQNLTADDTDPALISHDVEAGAVILASSRDPVLAAFGRVVLDEPGVPHTRVFAALNSYCYRN